MEKLSIEEKAQRYDEAVERVKEMIKAMTNIGGVAKVDDIQYLFPELKENDVSEDDRIMKAILSGLNYLEIELGWDAVGDVDILDAISWIEKQGEQKLACSKKDEDILDGIIEDIEVLKEDERNKDVKAAYQREIDWLKSLKDRYTWKPSDEQIKALDFAADCIVPAEFNFKRKELKGLLEQLKKLREE